MGSPEPKWAGNDSFEHDAPTETTPVKASPTSPMVSSNGGSAPKQSSSVFGTALAAISALLLLIVTVVTIMTLLSVKGLAPPASPAVGVDTPAAPASDKSMAGGMPLEAGAAFQTENPCEGKKPVHADAAAQDGYFNNVDCIINNVIQVLEQAGANVTEGYVGGLDAGDRVPITEPYWTQGLCPVNVHWHLGAEHLSVGEYDVDGTGPAYVKGRKLLAGSDTREGFQCHYYNPADPKFNTPYEWQHCKDMQVGRTYEVHWPHSAAGACGTPHQFQTPFYDGVFCTGGIISLDPLNTYQKIGVQGQIFTIVNDEQYYYPNLIHGMIVDGDMGKDIAKYTGSTTGTSRSNSVCSRYTPITWQVDRKCHLISASSFDKLCLDMKSMQDDMTGDLHPHGSRELVATHLVANNQQP